MDLLLTNICSDSEALYDHDDSLQNYNVEVGPYTQLLARALSF